MSNRIFVVPRSTQSMNDWRVLTEDGRFICDINLMVSSMLNGSRYHILDKIGRVVKNGVFNFGVWDEDTIEQLLTELVHKVAPDAEVEIRETA